MKRRSVFGLTAAAFTTLVLVVASFGGQSLKSLTTQERAGIRTGERNPNHRWGRPNPTTPESLKSLSSWPEDPTPTLSSFPPPAETRPRTARFEFTKRKTLSPPGRRRGVNNVKMLHTHDPRIADTEEFAKTLRQANAVWFDGGRQWNIVDSYANTLTYREFHKVLERGGVIGGSSAGATIQGAYLVRGAVAGPDIVMTTEPEHQAGFGFLRSRRSISTSTLE